MCVNTYGIERAVYEGMCMSFLTQLDIPSAKVMHDVIVKHVFPGGLQGHASRLLQAPR